MQTIQFVATSPQDLKNEITSEVNLNFSEPLMKIALQGMTKCFLKFYEHRK